MVARQVDVFVFEEFDARVGLPVGMPVLLTVVIVVCDGDCERETTTNSFFSRARSFSRRGLALTGCSEKEGENDADSHLLPVDHSLEDRMLVRKGRRSPVTAWFRGSGTDS